MGDRALHDALIRYLADSPFRAAVQGVPDGREYDAIPPEHVTALRAVPPDRADRFARFLARQFYYERIVHFYKYSRVLGRWTARWPEQVVRSDAFGALLPTLVLGSHATARDVARLVQEHLAGAPGAPPYAGDLLRYESAQFVAEAGPRVWRSDAPVPAITPRTVLAPDDGLEVVHLAWDVPTVLPALLTLAATRPLPAAPPAAERRATTLVVARAPRGRVTVFRWNATLDNFVAALDGTRDVAGAAAVARLPVAEGVEIAAQLRDAGVLVSPDS